MSATLRVADFVENPTLFTTPPPVLTVGARQHPVTIHFARRTDMDYVHAAVRKASRIHARLPPGGILIFLTGQNEITGVCRALETRFGTHALEKRRRRRTSRLSPVGDDQVRYEQAATVAPACAAIEAEDLDLGDSHVEHLASDIDDGQDMSDPEGLDSGDEDTIATALGIDAEETDVPMHIVPLYSLLPGEKQMKVFETPPESSRLVVVATNVAETSLTIPGIRYVIDCGRAKERRHDPTSGIQAFQISWISKASAAQRAGRAGRTGPGHCYRLFSSAVFEHYFPDFAQPEITRVPIEGIALQMKAMHIDAVVNFPFPTAPDRNALASAERTLVRLGALAPGTNQITDLGRVMALFPLVPRFAKMLANGRQKDCLAYVIAIVSSLSVGDPFLREEALEGEEDEEAESEVLEHITGEASRAKEARRLRRRAFFESQHTHGSLGEFTSDIFRTLSVVGAYEYAGGDRVFCAEHFVRPKAMEEIHKLRVQITHIAQVNFGGLQAEFVPHLQPPSSLQLKVLRQLLASAFIDQVAVRKDLTSAAANSGVQYTTTKGVAYRVMDADEDIFIHPSSILAGRSPPEYVVFSEIVRTSRAWMKGLTVVNPAWLSVLGKPALCTFSKPSKNKDGKHMVIPRFGPGWELPAIPAEKAI